MTLVIAGHHYKKGAFDSYKPKGVFVVADSMITAPGQAGGNTPLLSGFRKICPMPIKLWKPHFIDDSFHSYINTHYEKECVVAFAGSTLTAQHALNLIQEHLIKLRISYVPSREYPAPIQYTVQRACEPNPLETNRTTVFSDDIFLERDFDGLLTADLIADVVHHSIDYALSSAKKYRLSEDAFKAMRTDFILGVHCPKSLEYKLYKYRMNSRLNDDFVLEVFAEKEAIPEGQVACIGMSEQFGEEAQNMFSELIEGTMDTEQGMLRFLEGTIDQVNDSGSFAIGKPSVSKLLLDGRLQKLSVNH